MAKLHYPWTRYWSPIASDFRLSDAGYLSDPEGEHGHILNPDAVPFDELRNIPCLVLLGEPGIGKSTAMAQSDAMLQFDLGAYQTDATYFPHFSLAFYSDYGFSISTTFEHRLYRQRRDCVTADTR